MKRILLAAIAAISMTTGAHAGDWDDVIVGLNRMMTPPKTPAPPPRPETMAVIDRAPKDKCKEIARDLNDPGAAQECDRRFENDLREKVLAMAAHDYKVCLAGENSGERKTRARCDYEHADRMTMLCKVRWDGEPDAVLEGISCREWPKRKWGVN
jgi:hypothetical protein